ncbi:(-)-alpha-amorphene synthase [Streptomyces flavalbus]|uniref:(-)-alpha-amorphene synthase n=1 Tax=Streptomyces flavalbus TaxID=2665155 RepID=A0ABW2W427_9ACTN
MHTVHTVHEEIPADAAGEPRTRSLRELVDDTLYMPFPFQSHPRQSEAEAGVTEWLRSRGLTEDPAVADMIDRTRPAELASYNSPSVDLDILQIVANQIAYQFVFDDTAEEVGRRNPGQLLPMLCESVAILRDGQPPTTHLGAALSDLYRQVRERCTPAQAARWAWRSREYVHGLLYESVAQTQAGPVEVGLCCSVRALIAGVEPFYPLYEAAQPRELTDAELDHPVMRRLERLSADAAVWIPDLFSAVKEQRTGGLINLALAYQRAGCFTLPEAVSLAVRKINGTIEQIERLYQEIEPELTPAGVGYVEGMIGWIRGCYYWSRTVPRYADATKVAAEVSGRV